MTSPDFDRQPSQTLLLPPPTLILRGNLNSSYSRLFSFLFCFHSQKCRPRKIPLVVSLPKVRAHGPVSSRYDYDDGKPLEPRTDRISSRLPPSTVIYPLSQLHLSSCPPPLSPSTLPTGPNTPPSLWLLAESPIPRSGHSLSSSGSSPPYTNSTAAVARSLAVRRSRSTPSWVSCLSASGWATTRIRRWARPPWSVSRSGR